MKNKQVLSDLKMKELVDLGLNINDASAYYKGSYYCKKLLWKTGYGKLHPGSRLTYTTDDILRKLPKNISIEGYLFTLVYCPGSSIMYFDWNNGVTLVEFKLQSWQVDIDLLFDCLKWCIINKHLEIEKRD